MIPIKDTHPSYSTPVVTIVLIVINVLVFLQQFWLGLVDPYSMNEFMAQYALRPAYFRIENVFTSMFLHGGWMHLIGNMLFLWVFGDNVEDILGHGKFRSSISCAAPWPLWRRSSSTPRRASRWSAPRARSRASWARTSSSSPIPASSC
jgi:hypothetical protein